MVYKFLVPPLLFAMSGLCVFYYWQLGKADVEKRIYKVAVITKNAPYHENVTSGFLSALQNNQSFTCHVDKYFVEAENKLMCAAIIEEVIGTKPDVLFTIGAMNTLVAKSVTEKRLRKIPVVYAGAADPVGLGLVESLESSGNNVTGVNVVPPNDLEAAQLLRFIKKSLKRVLIPYYESSSGGAIAKQVNLIQSYFAKFKIKTTLLPIYKKSEIIEKVKNLITGHDTLMYMAGCSVGDFFEGLAKLCDQYGVTLFAGDPVVVAKDRAALGFGPYAELTGKKAFDYVRKILVDGARPTDLPIYFIEKGCKFSLNLDTAARQGLEVPEEIVLCMARGAVFRDGEEL